MTEKQAVAAAAAEMQKKKPAYINTDIRTPERKQVDLNETQLENTETDNTKQAQLTAAETTKAAVLPEILGINSGSHGGDNVKIELFWMILGISLISLVVGLGGMCCYMSLRNSSLRKNMALGAGKE